MKKRKIFLGLVTAAATLGLAACKTDDPETTPNPPVRGNNLNTVKFENNDYGGSTKEVKKVTKLQRSNTEEKDGPLGAVL